MADVTEFRTSFTFRIARDEIKRLSSQLSGLTSQITAVGDSIDSTQLAIDRKRKELRALTGKIGSRKKTLEKLRSKAERESLRAGKEVDSAECEAGEVEATYTTEDFSVAVIPMTESSPSPHKRKRFAGIWDDLDVDTETDAVHVEKRARVEVGGALSKENVAP